MIPDSAPEGAPHALFEAKLMFPRIGAPSMVLKYETRNQWWWHFYCNFGNRISFDTRDFKASSNLVLGNRAESNPKSSTQMALTMAKNSCRWNSSSTGSKWFQSTLSPCFLIKKAQSRICRYDISPEAKWSARCFSKKRACKSWDGR